MGHGRDVKDATKQEAVLDRRQYVVVVGEAKAVDFFFFRRLRSYRGMGQCTEVGSTYFQKEVRCGGISIDPSALDRAT